LAAGLGLGFVPMAMLSPDALADVLRYHSVRGLHIESTYGALIAIVDAVGGHAPGATLSFGSFNLDGPLPAALARASSFFLVASLAALTFGIARAPATDDRGRADRIALALLGGVGCVWLFGKVFSPQYMTWAIPLVLAVSAPLGKKLTWALVAAMAVSQLYLRGFYDYVTSEHALGVATLALRLSILVVMAFLIVRGLLKPAPVRSRQEGP
jgi:hypothetical protein